MTELSEQDLRDILQGASIRCGGGGGAPSEGEFYIDRILQLGLKPILKPLSAIPSSTIVAATTRMGACHPECKDLASTLTKSDHPPPSLAAFDALSKTVPSPIGALFPIATGPVNTLLPFFVAAHAGIPVLDADGAGRCVPELTQLAVELKTLPKNTIAIANYHGETSLLQGVPSVARAEKMLRAMSQASGDVLVFAEHALPLSKLSPGLVGGAVSGCLKAGRAWREARAAGSDVAVAVAASGGGKVLFSGKVAEYKAENKDGFTVGSMNIRGNGREATVSFRNENMAVTIDGVVVTTIPEVITILEMKSGQVVHHPKVAIGANVAVVVLPAPAPYLTEKGLSVFGPAYAGIDAPFRSAL